MGLRGGNLICSSWHGPSYVTSATKTGATWRTSASSPVCWHKNVDEWGTGGTSTCCCNRWNKYLLLCARLRSPHISVQSQAESGFCLRSTQFKASCAAWNQTVIDQLWATMCKRGFVHLLTTCAVGGPVFYTRHNMTAARIRCRPCEYDQLLKPSCRLTLPSDVQTNASSMSIKRHLCHVGLHRSKFSRNDAANERIDGFCAQIPQWYNFLGLHVMSTCILQYPTGLPGLTTTSTLCTDTVQRLGYDRKWWKTHLSLHDWGINLMNQPCQ
jgi:hypothetical protein